MIDLARRSVLVLELNEAERHFLERFVAEGRLPHFARLMREGVLLATRVPGWDARKDRAWRDISPWIVWPSLYTGLLPEEHGIVGFGQDTRHLRGKFVWEVLDAHRVPVGVFGSLMSYPPRSAGSARFYVPEGLADGPECIPEAARPVQEFNVLAARNYSEGFARQGVKALGLLLRSTRHGVRIGTALRTIAQLPAEKLFGAHREPERAMLASAIAVDAFEALYREHRPAYAALHLNHVAYMQHRYWRAAEPHRFEEGLSETDRRFFGDVAARRAYEERFAHWIRTSFEYSDRVLGRLVELAPEGAVVLVATALGQRPFDPCHEIHNPVVRLVRERELLDALGLADYTVLHQMNPDVTVNLRDEASAARAAEAAAGLHVVEDEPLFTVQRRGAQVFLELNMPRRSALAGEARIRHRALPGLDVPLGRHIVEHGNADQSTAHHKDVGFLLAWRKGGALEAESRAVPVTAVAPTVLSLFGIPPQPWHHADAPPALRLA